VQAVTKSVLYGEVLIAVVQGLLGGIIFFFAGIPSPLFWGFIMAVLAFLPIVGSGMVWIPAGLIKIANNEILNGVLIIILGFVVIGGVDYLMRPKIISGASKTHPLVALIGAFGGLKVFGFVGLILGPLLAALFEALVMFYYEDKKNGKNKPPKEKVRRKRKKR
jgi:predicted PurR-regulated permease PerM